MEGGTKVGAINDGMTRRLRVVEVFASSAVKLYGRGVGDVGLPHWEERLRLAHYTGAFSKVGLFELLKLVGVSGDDLYRFWVI